MCELKYIYKTLSIIKLIPWNTTTHNSPPISQQRGASGTGFMANTRQRLISKKYLSNITNMNNVLFLKYVLLLFLYKRFLPKTTKQYILTYSKKNIEVKKTYWKSFIDPKKTWLKITAGFAKNRWDVVSLILQQPNVMKKLWLNLKTSTAPFLVLILLYPEAKTILYLHN